MISDKNKQDVNDLFTPEELAELEKGDQEVELSFGETNEREVVSNELREEDEEVESVDEEDSIIDSHEDVSEKELNEMSETDSSVDNLRIDTRDFRDALCEDALEDIEDEEKEEAFHTRDFTDEDMIEEESCFEDD